MKKIKELFDDKNLVILSILIITVTSIFILGLNSKEVILNAFSGLFGVAVGKISKQ